MNAKMSEISLLTKFCQKYDNYEHSYRTETINQSDNKSQIS